MAGNVATVQIGITADTDSASANIEQVSSDIQHLYDVLREVSQSLAQADGRMDDVSESANEASGSLSSVAEEANNMVGALAAFLSLDAAAGVLGMADGMTDYTKKLRNATTSEEQYNQVLERTYAVSQLTSTGLEGNIKTVAELSKAIREHGGTVQQASDLHELLAKSLKIDGASADDAAESFDIMKEAMQLGIIEGGDLEQMLVKNSTFVNNLAESLGTTTVGLLAMADAGQLTVNKMLSAIPGMANKIDNEFSNVALNVDDAFQRISNSFSKAVLDANETSEGTNKVAIELNNIAVIIDQNSEVIERFFVTIATGAAYAVRAVAGIDGIFRGAAAAATLLAGQTLEAVKSIVELAGKVGLMDDSASKVAELDLLINAAEQSSLDLANQARDSWSVVFQSQDQAAASAKEYNQALNDTLLKTIDADTQVKQLEQSTKAAADAAKGHADVVQLLGSSDSGIAQYRQEVKLIDGVWQNVSVAAQQAMQSSSAEVSSLNGESANLEATWKKIDGVWTEVFEDGRALAGELKEEINESADAADRLGGNLAAANEPASEAQSIIADLVDGYDAASGASGELASNLDKLAQKKAQMNALQLEIDTLTEHLRRSRDNAEQTKQILEKMAVAEAAQRKLSGEISGLEDAIDGAGDAAEETTEKIERIPSAASRVSSSVSEITDQVRNQVDATRELGEAIEGVSAKADSFGTPTEAGSFGFEGAKDLRQMSDEELQAAIKADKEINDLIDRQAKNIGPQEYTVNFGSRLSPQQEARIANQSREDQTAALQDEVRKRRLESVASNISARREQSSGQDAASVAEDKESREKLAASIEKLATSIGASNSNSTININGITNIDQVEQELRRRGLFA